MPTFRELSYIILSSNIDAKSPRQRRLSRTLLRCPSKDIKDTKNPVDDHIYAKVSKKEETEQDTTEKTMANDPRWVLKTPRTPLIRK